MAPYHIRKQEMSIDKVIIRHENPEELKSDRRFKIAVQLSRLLNTLRANQRQYLRVPDDGDPANKRDRFELILYHGAIVYEAMKTITSYGADLSQTATWRELQDTVQSLQEETNNPNSFTQKYLKLIRNKILFHYDVAAIEGALQGYPLSSDQVFAEATSESILNLSFVLADEFILNYLMQRIKEKSSANEKWAFFEERLFEISENLCSVLYGCFIDLIKGFAYIEEHGPREKHVPNPIRKLAQKFLSLFGAQVRTVL